MLPKSVSSRSGLVPKHVTVKSATCLCLFSSALASLRCDDVSLIAPVPPDVPDRSERSSATASAMLLLRPWRQQAGSYRVPLT